VAEFGDGGIGGDHVEDSAGNGGEPEDGLPGVDRKFAEAEDVASEPDEGACPQGVDWERDGEHREAGQAWEEEEDAE